MANIELASPQLTSLWLAQSADGSEIRSALEGNAATKADGADFASQLNAMEETSDAEAIEQAEELLRRQQEAIREFESMFASLIIKELRNSAKGLFEGDTTDSLGALFDQHMGQEMTKGGGLGVSSQLNRYLEIQQQAQSTTESRS